MKKLLKILILLVVLIVAALGFLVYRLDSIAKAAVEEGGTYALGVPTTLDGIKLGLISGTCELNGLDVANPPGNYEGNLFELGRGAVSVSLASLREDVIDLPSLQISDVLVSLERVKGGSNYQTILDNIKKNTGGEGSGSGAGSDGGDSSGKKFIVREVKIENVTINAQLLPEVGELAKVSLNVPAIELKNIGTGGSSEDRGVALSELVSILVRAILDAAVNSGGLPAELLGDLKGRLAAIGDLKSLGVETVNKLKADLDQAKEKILDEAADPGKLLEGAKDLLGGDDEEK